MPFERFSRERLDSLLVSHPLSPPGLQFLESELAAPSRNVQGGTHNVISDLPCPKMCGNAQSESWNVEEPFTLEHIFNNQILGYTNQVPRIELRYKGKNGHTVRTGYTGDCLVFDQSLGLVLEEYKSASDRGQLEEKFPGKYYRLESGEYTSTPIFEVVNPWGIAFAVRFSDEISPVAHRNRKFLINYLQPSAPKTYAPKLQSLLRMFAGEPLRSYADLLESGADSDVLNWAIAFGHLHIDFDAALLSTEPSRVLVFLHAEALKAWCLAVRPDGSRPDVESQFIPEELRPDDVFIFDGKRLTVTMHGATAIHAKDERGDYVTVDLRQFVNAKRDGKLVLPATSHSQESLSRFWKVSPLGMTRAIKRIEILERLNRGDDLPLEDQHSASTFRRWRRAIREGEAQGLSPVEALLDFGDEKGFRGTHIDAQLSIDINEWIRVALSDKKSGNTHDKYFAIKEMVEQTDRVMIAKSCFYERASKIRSLKMIRDSQGHKVAYQLEPSYWMLDLDTPVHCERALELVHFDSTLLDVELRSSLSGEILGRPWLSIAVCAYSRRVVGMYLSFRPPSYVSSMMLLADIVQRFGRLPDAIIHDWGSEFKAKNFKDALTALFIKRHVRPKSAPRFGAVLERMFGVVTRELIDNIAGNTKLRKNVRQLTPQSDPSTHSGLWLMDIYQGLEEYFFGIYDKRKHPTTLRLPHDSYDASFIAHGIRLHRIRRYEEILPVLMPTAKGRPRVVDPSRGIFVNYRYYGHPSLTSLSMTGASAMVKPIPFDPGRVLAFVKGDWIVCRYGVQADLQRAPEVVKRCLFEEWSIEQRLVRSSHDDTRERTRKLIENLNQKALENKEYWRDREAHALLAVADFSEPMIASQVETTALTKLDQMMKSALAAASQSNKFGTFAGEEL